MARSALATTTQRKWGRRRLRWRAGRSRRRRNSREQCEERRAPAGQRAREESGGERHVLAPPSTTASLMLEFAWAANAPKRSDGISSSRVG